MGRPKKAHTLDKRVSVRLSDQTYAAYEQIAAVFGVPVGQLLRQILTVELDQLEPVVAALQRHATGDRFGTLPQPVGPAQRERLLRMEQGGFTDRLRQDALVRLRREPPRDASSKPSAWEKPAAVSATTPGAVDSVGRRRMDFATVGVSLVVLLTGAALLLLLFASPEEPPDDEAPPTGCGARWQGLSACTFWGKGLIAGPVLGMYNTGRQHWYGAEHRVVDGNENEQRPLFANV
jgi:hypothetical protein